MYNPSQCLCGQRRASPELKIYMYTFNRSCFVDYSPLKEMDKFPDTQNTLICILHIFVHTHTHTHTSRCLVRWYHISQPSS